MAPRGREAIRMAVIELIVSHEAVSFFMQVQKGCARFSEDESIFSVQEYILLNKPCFHLQREVNSQNRKQWSPQDKTT